MTIYIANDEDHRRQFVRWAEERLDSSFGDDAHALAIFGDAKAPKLLAVSVYSAFRGTAGKDLQCEISFASDSPLWAKPDNVRFILWYPLIHLNCRRITAITRADNERVHRVLKKIGFMKEGRHADMFHDGPAITFGMTRRWFLKAKDYGKVIPIAA